MMTMMNSSSEEASNPAIETEIEKLRDFDEHARLDVRALWNFKGSEFTGT